MLFTQCFCYKLYLHGLVFHLSLTDTGCAGPVRDLQTTSITSTSIALTWTEPELIVGPDFHYTYQIFDPNGNSPTAPTRLPFTELSRDMTLTVSGLQPATVYVIGIATINDVCDANIRRVDIQVKTRDDGRCILQLVLIASLCEVNQITV